MQVPQTVRQFIKDFESVITQSATQKRLAISRGSVPNMEAYNRAVGQIEGMENAVATAKEMIRQMREAEEDNELPEMENTG